MSKASACFCFAFSSLPALLDVAAAPEEAAVPPEDGEDLGTSTGAAACQRKVSCHWPSLPTICMQPPFARNWSIASWPSFTEFGCIQTVCGASSNMKVKVSKHTSSLALRWSSCQSDAMPYGKPGNKFGMIILTAILPVPGSVKRVRKPASSKDSTMRSALFGAQQLDVCTASKFCHDAVLTFAACNAPCIMIHPGLPRTFSGIMGEEEGMAFAPEISARRAKMAATSPLPPSTAVPAHVLTPTATTTCQYHGMAKKPFGQGYYSC